MKSRNDIPRHFDTRDDEVLYYYKHGMTPPPLAHSAARDPLYGIRIVPEPKEPNFRNISRKGMRSVGPNEPNFKNISTKGMRSVPEKTKKR